jgi:septal ring factor EnvC (AmiA/AmiB activator)
MVGNIENLMLEHLKKIQAELAAIRNQNQEFLSRLARIESSGGRTNRDIASIHEEAIEDRHAVDKLRERVERIERRLELNA